MKEIDEMKEAETEQDSSHRYLMITAAGEQSDFRIQMLVHQQMKELLPCTVRRVNGKLRIAYDTGSRLSLLRFCESRSIGFELLSALFRMIGNVYREMREYLLDADMLLLKPAYIYVEEAKKAFFFCCAPGNTNRGGEPFHELCLFLLRHLDDTDDEAVQLCYRMYRNSERGGFRPEDFAAPDTTEEKQPCSKEISSVQTAAALPGEHDKPKKQKSERVKSEKTKQEKFKWPWMKEITAQLKPLPAYAGEKLFAYGGKGCVLHAKKKGLPMFTPAAFPFLVGSLEFAVDGYIDDVTVSRFHAQLEKKEDGYYVTDLDSAHGTRINGKTIKPQSAAKISDGDEICFGDAVYAISV